MINNTPALKVILTDDDADDRSIFSEAFRELKLPTDLKMFSDGSDLMEYLRSTDSDLPQLVMLDLNMPRKSGFECLREIRSDKKLKDLLVAIYSTSSSEKDIEETFAGGANLYIKKPCDYSKLKKIIREVIQTHWQLSTSRRNRDKFYFTV